MSNIVDLSRPIEPHFRWSFERSLAGDLARGDPFQVTKLNMVVHCYTHMDTPRHVAADGATTSDIGLDRLCREAAVVDLTAIEANGPIEPDRLARAGGHIRADDIVLLHTGWDARCSVHDAEFWTTAPYLTREACEWLLAKKIGALGVDFPQDYAIRRLFMGESPPIGEYFSHDILLRNGVLLIEYLCNLAAIEGERTMLYILPLKIPESDGAPARVIAHNG